MNHLPPPPPNAAPYVPPPQGGQHYQHPYQAQPTYPPPPVPGYGNPPYQQNAYGQDQSSLPRNGPPGPPKAKMQVTRYPPPPGRRPYPSQQAPLNQPPPTPPYQTPNWAPAQYGQPPINYPPPPPQPASHHPPPQHPPPPNQASYAGYNQVPPPYPSYPPPPSQSTAYPQYPPPPVNHSYLPWSASQALPAQYQSQPAWSPPPSTTSQHRPPPSRIPAQSVASSAYPSAESEVIKDRNDPTFYDGWDNDEFDMGEVVWPKTNDVIDERFSIGQHIWHPPERITRAISSNIDIPLLAAPVSQRYDRAKELIVSKYFQGKENENEGLEYVYTFQRIRYVEEEWAERRNDPMFRTFLSEDTQKYLDVEQVKEQVLEDARQLRESDPRGESDVMGSLEQALSSYIGTAVPSLSTEDPDGKTTNTNGTEALLASLGVSGEAKPVYTTPFPAYATSEEQIFTPLRRASSVAQPPYHAPPPQHANPPPPQQIYNAPPPSLLQPPSSIHRSPPYLQPPYQHQAPTAGYFPNRPPHMGYPNYPPPPPPTSGWRPSTPSYNRKRSASVDSFADPWKIGSGRDNTPSAQGPGTPVGSDFGEFHVNGSASENTLKAESRSPPERQAGEHGEYKKRKIDEHEGLQRKRSKPKVNVDPAYSRRW